MTPPAVTINVTPAIVYTVVLFWAAHVEIRSHRDDVSVTGTPAKAGRAAFGGSDMVMCVNGERLLYGRI